MIRFVSLSLLVRLKSKLAGFREKMLEKYRLHRDLGSNKGRCVPVGCQMEMKNQKKSSLRSDTVLNSYMVFLRYSFKISKGC